MAKLYIIRGIPGSGKSTIAKKLLEEGKVDTHWETDMFFTTKDGVYMFNRDQVSDAHRKCQEKVCQDLTSGKNVAVSNTFVKNWEMMYYFDLAKALNAEVEVIRATGCYNNVHGVPFEVVERMVQTWETLNV